MKDTIAEYRREEAKRERLEVLRLHSRLGITMDEAYSQLDEENYLSDMTGSTESLLRDRIAEKEGQ